MSDRTKEDIYDEEISPLMRQIIKICRENNIANICSFAFEDGTVDTIMVEDRFDPPEKLKECVKILYPEREILTLIVNDGEKTSINKIF